MRPLDFPIHRMPEGQLLVVTLSWRSAAQANRPWGQLLTIASECRRINFLGITLSCEE
jgi:hypothetical protein